MFRQIMTAICLVSLSGSSLAGAWDVGPFDNDDALDWVWELTDSDDLSALDRAFEQVLRSPEYVEAPTASIAIAAAEVLAAVRGQPADGLPDEVVDWVQGHRLKADERLATRASKAIERIMDDDISELAQLWADSPELASAWRSGLKDLLGRLQQG